MNDPWILLELDPSTATEKDIKRAYAKRLKVTRPDQNPEGFKELNDAYQFALYLIARGPVNAPQETVRVDTPSALVIEDETSPEGERAVSVPQAAAGENEIKQATSLLEDAIVRDQQNVASLVRDIEQCLYRYPTSAQVWSMHVAPLIEQYPCHPDLLLKPDVLLYELEQGSCDVTLAVINRLDRMGKKDALQGLAQYFHKSASRLATPLGARILGRLAFSAGMWELSFVDALANTAYEQLPISERDYTMDLIDQYKRLGIYLHGVPNVWRYFWAKFFLGNAARQDWTSEEGEAALMELAKTRSRLWHCYPEIMEMLPPDIVKLLPSLAERNAKSSRSRTAAIAPQFLKTWQYLPQPVETVVSSTVNSGSTIERNTNDNWLHDELNDRKRPPRKTRMPSTQQNAVPPAAPYYYSGTRSNNFPIGWVIFIVVKIIFLISHCSS